MKRIIVDVQTGEQRVVQLTAEEIAQAQQMAQVEAQRVLVNIDQMRKAAYAAEADPLFFKWQAGEATVTEWRAKRDEIKARFPK